MAVTAIGRDSNFKGLRRLDPALDLRQVTALIAETFGDRLDAEGRSALREMQQVSRLGPLIRVFLAAYPQLQRMLNGYVWIEEGKVVGNLTLHGGTRFGSRWYIYNVAVSPGYRGRGIAKAVDDDAVHHTRRSDVSGDNAVGKGQLIAVESQGAGFFTRACTAEQARDQPAAENGGPSIHGQTPGYALSYPAGDQATTAESFTPSPARFPEATL